MESVWLKPEAWPRNSREWVFLAHAVDVIGHRMFGSDWRLDYFATGVMKQLPYYEDVQQPLSGALPRDRHYGTRLLAYVMLRKTNPSYRPQVHSAPSPF